MFGRNRPLISFEFFPPRSAEADVKLAQALNKLRGLSPSFVSVTYGAGGSTRDRTVQLVSSIKCDLHLEAMAHLTCVGANRIEIDSVLARLAGAGIENVLALRGDPEKGQAEFVRHEGGFGHASELTAFIRGKYAFSIGGACYPECHVECRDPVQDLHHLKLKVEAGADFLITQLFFEPKVYFDFVLRAHAAGIRLPIIPGVMPVTNVDQLERFTSMCGASIPAELRSRLEKVRDDPDKVKDAGIEHATQQCIRLLEGGAPGIHFYTLNRSPSTRAIFTHLRAKGLV